MGDDRKLSANHLLGLAHLFKLTAQDRQPTPGHVFVPLSVQDCEALGRLLLAESIRLREVEDADA